MLTIRHSFSTIVPCIGRLSFNLNIYKASYPVIFISELEYQFSASHFSSFSWNFPYTNTSQPCIHQDIYNHGTTMLQEEKFSKGIFNNRQFENIREGSTLEKEKDFPVEKFRNRSKITVLRKGCTEWGRLFYRQSTTHVYR